MSFSSNRTKRSVAIALILVVTACFAAPIDEQQVIGHWKTRETSISFSRRNIRLR